MLILSKQKGVSLIELMIGLAIGMIAVSGLVSFVGFGIGVNSKAINKSQLSEETETLVDFMASEITRAGYSGSTVAMLQDPNANPSVFANSIAVSRHPNEDPDTCITYSYDFNGNGVVDTLDVNENFGFRLRGGAIQIRQQGADCNADINWSTISDTNVIEIDRLVFVLTPVVIDGVTRNQIDLFVETESKVTTSFSASLSRSFTVRNYD
jgi:prepilin peptidase dependent protein B